MRAWLMIESMIKENDEYDEIDHLIGRPVMCVHHSIEKNREVVFYEIHT